MSQAICPLHKLRPHPVMTADVGRPGRLCPQRPEQSIRECQASASPGACQHLRAAVLVSWRGVWLLPSDVTPSAEHEEKPRGGKERLVWVSVAPNALVMQKTRIITLRIFKWMWSTHEGARLLPKAEGRQVKAHRVFLTPSMGKGQRG